MPKKHTPTRLCPHRWCRPAHLLIAAVGITAIAPLIFHSLIVFALMAVMSFVGYAVIRAVRGKTLTELSTEDIAASHGNGRIPHLVVRPGWARAAIACDFFLLFQTTGAAFLTLRDPSGEAHRMELSAGDLMPIFFGVAVIAFEQYSHKKATEPAKPLRLPVLAPSEGGA